MRELLTRSGLGPIGASIGLHVVLVGLLVFSFSFGSTPPALPPAPKAIEAVIVDEALVQREMEKLERQEKADEEAARHRRQEAEDARRKAEEEAARLEKLKNERLKAEQEKAAREEAEHQRKVKLEQERKEAEAREARERQAREEAEKKRLAELERKRKEEEARLARIREEQKKAEEARKAEEKRQREAEEARIKAQRQEELRLAMAEEERRREAEDAGLLAQYIAIIKQRVQRNWIRPPEAQAGLECEVFVSQIPGGEVVGVRFGNCNGDDVVRRSIESAVLRASPLPAPADPSLFERNLVFVFKPE